MANATVVYIDANEDLETLASHLISLLKPTSEVSFENDDPLSRNYSFLANDNRTHVRIEENWEVYLWRADTSRYRFKVNMLYGHVFGFARDLYKALEEADTWTVLLQGPSGDILGEHCPQSFIPDYSIIIRKMPVEILIEADIKDRPLRRALGISGPSSRSDLGILYDLSKLNPSDKEPGSRYYERTANYCLRVFGIDDGPQRRQRRDAYASEVYARIQQAGMFNAEIYEVIACQFVPFQHTL